MTMTRWQKSVTLKAIRENRVAGFDVGFVATPDDMCGKLEPFFPCWNAQYLGDGTQDFFDTIKETQEWLIEWDEIGL
tara:strand:- start:47 stop:277 length:231 start_codon:yes stop_codon:yes gene_type:complete